MAFLVYKDKQVVAPIGETKNNWEINPAFLKEIIVYICALLNCISPVHMFFECRDLKTNSGLTLKEIDQFKQKIENKVKNVFGSSVLYGFISIYDVKVGQIAGFVCKIRPCPDFCSVKYNMFLPASSQLIELTFNSFENIADIMKNKMKEEPLKKEAKESFVLDESFGESESNEMQFKRYNDENMYDLQFLIDKLQDESIRHPISHYMSAFANHKGGRMYFGIEDRENKIKGQKLKESDQEKINGTFGNIFDSMTWNNVKPKKGQDWDVQYIPVLDKKGSRIEDLFVIALSVRYIPYGAFSEDPQSYKWHEGQAVAIPFDEWRQRMLLRLEDYIRCIEIGVVDQVVRKQCYDIINEVDRQVDSGDKPDKVLECVAQKQKELSKSNAGSNDPRILTCYLQSAYLHYRINDYRSADVEMSTAEKYLTSEQLHKNKPVLELHRSCLQASMARKSADFDKSLRLTYECLVETDAILPGWENSMVWKTHGHTLAEMASKEEDQYRKRKRIRDAERAWCNAIHHAQKVILTRQIPTEEKKKQYALMNIIQLCHLYLALLALGITPNGESLKLDGTDTANQSDDDHDGKEIERLKAVLITRQCDYPFSNRTECLFKIVLSLLPKDDDARKYGEDFLDAADREKIQGGEISIAQHFARQAQKIAKKYGFTDIGPLARHAYAISLTKPHLEQAQKGGHPVLQKIVEKALQMLSD